MTGHENKTEEMFRDKPECIINFPEEILPESMIAGYKENSGLAIVEMAGRDSVAAALKCIRDEGFTDLLPTYVYTGTEYGNWSGVPEAVRRLKKRLPEDVRVHDLIVFGSPQLWRALNGRFMSVMVKTYGAFTPCLGCHLYLHISRVPLSVLLGNKPVICGERESHDGSIKINQIKEALDGYKAACGFYNVPLLMPIRYIEDGGKIEDILGLDWQQDMDQLGCVLSGNYRDCDGKNSLQKEYADHFLNDFAIPFVKEVIDEYLNGNVPDHIKTANRILKE